jgi:Tol biopolymer transport system component
VSAVRGHSPTWSPNGGVVLFTQKSGTTRNVMRVSGTSTTATATVLIPNASQPDWQPVR